MDVLIFMGQSNMQGSTGEKCFEPTGCGVFEYRYLTNELKPLISPVGEDIESDTGELLLTGSALGNGSMVPYFANVYAKSRGKTVAIHSAKGNTSIAEWKKGTERFNIAVEKIKAGIKKAAETGNVNRVYVIWLQGESDALLRTSQEEYEKSLKQFKNDLKNEFSFNKFCIIKTGYFAAYAEWDKDLFEDKKAADEAIMSAQDSIVKKDSDFVMLTDVTVELSINALFLNPKEFGPHFNNAGMKIIGETAARELLKLQ